MRRALLAAVTAVTAAALLAASGAGGQVRTDVCEQSVLPNGSFEQPVIDAGRFYQVFPDSQVGGWQTDSPQRQIELWKDGFLGVPAAQGNQLAEIAAGRTLPVSLFQDAATTPGEPLSYAFSHRGRNGLDTMELRIGPPGGPPSFTRRVTTGNRNWQQVLGDYVVPEGQTTTRFAFAWVNADQGTDTGTVGNLLDGVVVARATCTLQIRKVVVPASDPGRVDLYAGDELVAASAGNGDSSPVIPMALPAVRVHEQAADPIHLENYASSVRCVDADSGEAVASAGGTEVTLAYDQPRNVVCTFVNVRGPALTLEKQTYPATDPARFTLRLDDKTIALAAGDDHVSDPEPVLAGTHTVRSILVAGPKSTAAYGSSVQCATHGVRRIGVTPGRSARIQVGPELRATCVFVDVRSGAPDPRPPEPEPGPPLGPQPGAPSTPGAPPTTAPPVAGSSAPPDTGGDGELDLVVHAHAAGRRIEAGGRAQFRVRVTNRGSVAATGVRLVLSATQAGVRVGSLTTSIADGPGPCASAQGLAFCLADRIAPGAGVTLRVTASSREVLNPVRLLAVADAAEPERVVANNANAAIVGVTRPAAEPCVAAAALRARAAC